jgi:xanthine dehydrogenase YagS FAD-binding subunit
VLSQAVGGGGSPQIRNQGTLGGNVSQDVRCWYYRGGWPCYRAGGNICYADTPVGRNREHAIFGANRCVAVHPSDSVPALIALDAKFVMQTRRASALWMRKTTSSGRRSTSRDQYSAARRSAYGHSHSSGVGRRKVLFRESARPQCVGLPADERGFGDGAQGGNIDRIRIAVSAVAPRPMRLKAVEDAVRGKPADATLPAKWPANSPSGCGSAAVQRVQDSA